MCQFFNRLCLPICIKMKFNKYTENIYSIVFLKWKYHRMGLEYTFPFKRTFLLSFHLKMSYKVLVYDT